MTTDPADADVTVGLPATFTSTASGDPAPTVQWQVSDDDGTTFTDIEGATTTTYSTLVGAGDSGNQYRAVLTSSTGTATSTAATLTVNDDLQVTTTSLPVATGGEAFSNQLQAAGGATPTYRWRKIKGSLPAGVSLGSNGMVSGTPRTRAASHLYSFTVRVTTGSHAQKSDATQTLALTVLP